VVIIIKNILWSNSLIITELFSRFDFEYFSIALKELLINLGVNSEKIWAIMVIRIPNKK
jgi:hypothetical protein